MLTNVPPERPMLILRCYATPPGSARFDGWQ